MSHLKRSVACLALTVPCAMATATIVQAAQPAAAPEYYPMPSTGTPLPFSSAVKAGNILYVSGQIGNLPGTLNLAPGGIGPETSQTLENIKAILEAHHTSLDRVIKCTVYLADIHEWGAFNEVYRQYFKTNPPARSALATNGLAANARTEVECMAYVP